MTIEQIKEEAKKRFNKDITDEQAQAILENYCSEELSAQTLEKVTGGYKLDIRLPREVLPKKPIIICRSPEPEENTLQDQE